MKKLLSLMALVTFLFAGALSASAISENDFTTNNKKSGDYVYSLGSYAVGVDIAVVPSDQVVNIPFDQVYFKGSNGATYYKNGTNVSAATVTNGANVITACMNDEFYVQLFDSIKVGFDILPELTLDKHNGFGSKVSEANSLPSGIKEKIGSGKGITNNKPYTNLEAAIDDAYAVFAVKTYNTKTYESAKSTMYLANDGYWKMFGELEKMRDSLAILCNYYYNGMETAKDDSQERHVYEFPGNQAIFEGINQELDGEKVEADGIWKSLLTDLKEGGSYALINGDIAQINSTKQQLYDNCKRYSKEEMDFFVKMNDPSSYQEATSNNNYPTIPNISYGEYGAFIKVPTLKMADAATKFGKEVAAWSGSAPFISYSGIALATLTFAADMAFAGMLMAENIKHIMTLQETIDWLNQECQDDYAYEFLSAEQNRSRMNLRSAQVSSVAELQHDILKKALARAKEMHALGLSKKDLSKVIITAQDAYNNMNENRTNTLGGNFATFMAKTKLHDLIAEAQSQMDIQYVEKIVKYDYSKNGGEFSLYDLNWYNTANVSFAADQVFGIETPHEIVDREATKLNNGLALCESLYGLEEELDNLIAYMNSGVFASPKKTVNDVWQAGEELKAQANNNKALIEDKAVSGNTVKGINTMLQEMATALQLAQDHQAIIDQAISDTNDTIASLKNNGPADKLTGQLEAAIEKFESDDYQDWNKVKDAITLLEDQRHWDMQTYDKPDNYLGGTPDGQFEGMIAQAETFFEANVANMTPEQVTAVEFALAVSKTALAEWEDSRYNDQPWSLNPINDGNELERDYLLDRMYYAGLALEYIQKMTVSADGQVHVEDADQQLAEAIALVAIAAASNGEAVGQDVDDVLAEANIIFRDNTSTDTEKADEARKLRALLKSGLTGITEFKANNAQLRDGKYVENGKMVIVKGGKKFNAVGVAF